MSEFLSTLVIARQKRLAFFQTCVQYFIEQQPSWFTRLNPFRTHTKFPNLLFTPKDLDHCFETTWLLIRPSDWKQQIVYDTQDVNSETAAVALFFIDVMKPTMSSLKVSEQRFPETCPLYVDYGLKLDWIIRKKCVFATIALDYRGMPQSYIRFYYMGATTRGLIEWLPSSSTIKLIRKRPFASDLYALPWFTSQVLKDYESLYINDKFDDPIGYCIPPASDETLISYKASYLEKVKRDMKYFLKQYPQEEKEKTPTE